MVDIATLENLSPGQRVELSKLLTLYDEAEKRGAAQTSFMSFIKLVWPNFIEGRHHKIISDAFERVANGQLKRLIVTLPPRHTKSMFCSVYFPAWFLGRFPGKKVIQASSTAELAVGFGRQVKNLITDSQYQKIFPGMGLQADSKASGRWNTNQAGDYFAIGVGGTVTGRGGDIILIDDPVGEQEAAIAESNPEIYDKVFDWYTSGPRQRLQPGGAIVILMTRWSKRDLVGRVMEAQIAGGTDQWEIIEFPAIMPSGEPLWPEFWSKEELLATKAEIPLAKWNAQYQQNPTSSESALIRREWWQEWHGAKPPPCEVIMSSFDTAFGKSDRSNYSACTTWGVFKHDDPDSGEKISCLILLDAWREKLSFPELKSEARRHYDEWKPDIMIIEEKAAGGPLIYELRAMGIPVQSFLPSRGNDKISRVNAIADIFASKRVFYSPDMKFSEEVIDEVSEFPAGRYDDYVDTVSQALLRFRQGGWIQTKHDDWGPSTVRRRRREYY